MNGALPRPAASLLPPDVAARLLDDVIYDRVLECIDFEQLWCLETELRLAVEDDTKNAELAKTTVRDMIVNALVRFSADTEQHSSGFSPAGDCELCDEEAAFHRCPEPVIEKSARPKS